MSLSQEIADESPFDEEEVAHKTKLAFSFFFEPDKHQPMLVLRKNAPISQEDAETLGVIYNEKGEYWWMNSPRQIHPHFTVARIKNTFDNHNYDVGVTWPKNEHDVEVTPDMMPIDGYKECTEALRIAQNIIPEFHPKLAPATIKYVTREFSPKIDDDDNVNYLKLHKLSGVGAWIAKTDFIVEICAAVWRALNTEQKKALVDNALAHFSTSKRGKWRKRKSQVAANVEVVQRRGDLDGTARQLVDALNSNNNPVQSIRSVAKRVVEQLKALSEE